MDELRRSYTTLDELWEHGLISEEEKRKLVSIGSAFQIRISPYYAGLIDSTSPVCPIKLQAVPALTEEDPSLPDWVTDLSLKIYGRPVPWHSDPIGDLEKKTAPRLTHRYQERALLHFSSVCTMYCRFCFRKSHLNDQTKKLYEGNYDASLVYLKEHPEIRELILTGGDPLSMTDAVLESFFSKLEALSSLKTLRIHSRVVVTLPSRITSRLLDLFQKTGIQVVLVNHFNHPRELTPQSTEALLSLKKRGVTLLNQSVLLRSINDSTACLKELFMGLYERGVLPFYLHHPDWTPGTFYFRRSIAEGILWMRALRGSLSGPALPDYVLDIPHGGGKISLMEASIRRLDHREEKHQGRLLQATVYEVSPPSTRSEIRSPTLYLDLSWK